MLMLRIITSLMLFVMETCLVFEFCRERKVDLPIFEKYVYLYIMITLGLSLFCIWI